VTSTCTWGRLCRAEPRLGELRREIRLSGCTSDVAPEIAWGRADGGWRTRARKLVGWGACCPSLRTDAAYCLAMKVLYLTVAEE